MTDTTNTRRTFVEFMARDGYARAHAAWEFDNVLTVNRRFVVRSHYLTVSRLGAPFTLTRAARAAVFETLGNARNHATFDTEA